MRWLPAFLLLACAACDRGPDNTPPPEETATLPPSPAGPEPGADPGQTARLAPADGLIACARGSELWLIKGDGSDAGRVLRMEGDVARPAWSPNRKWIAFSSTAGATHNLYARNLFIVRPDGSGLRQVTPLPRSGENLEHAPKGTVRGRAVALLETGRLGMKDFSVAAYGRAALGTTQEGGLFETYAPIGTSWIKVSGTFKNRRYSGAAMGFVREGTVTDVGEVMLTLLGADHEADVPGWSPDGRSLYYMLRVPDPRHAGAWRAASLNRVGLDGTHGEQIYASPTAQVDCAAVAGDGIIVTLRDWRLLKISPETRQPLQQWKVGTALPDAVAVAPDGSTIAYTRLNAKLQMEVVVRASEEKVLATLAEGRVGTLDFSPDGRTLAYDFRGASGSDIFAVDLDTGALRVLTRGGQSSHPAWYGR